MNKNIPSKGKIFQKMFISGGYSFKIPLVSDLFEWDANRQHQRTRRTLDIDFKTHKVLKIALS